METYVIPLTTGTLRSRESDAEVFNEVDGSEQLSKGSVFSGVSDDDCTAPTWDD